MQVEHEVSAPRSSNMQATGAPGYVYDYNILMDGANNADVLYGFVELFDYDPATKLHRARRPTADSLPWQVVGGLPGAKVEAATDRIVAVATFQNSMRPIIACIDATSDAPAIGDSVGTMNGSFALKVGNTGFVVTGVIVDGGGRRYVLVRPSGQGGGGGATLTVVQATGDGASGSVNTEAMTFKADITASPNFTLSGVTVVAKYFKL